VSSPPDRRTGAFDLDHVGAEIGERLRAPRAGEHAREVEHAHAGQGLRVGVVVMAGLSCSLGIMNDDDPRSTLLFGGMARPDELGCLLARARLARVRARGCELASRLPCRPDRHARVVAISDAKVEMTMLVCSAGERPMR
jgi:hypothetical protein